MSKKLTTEEFTIKAKDKHGNKYEYSLVEYLDNKIKVTIICPFHGGFEQIPNTHLLGIGCKKCGIIVRANKRRSIKETFILNANIIHNNKFDYSLVEYQNTHAKIKIICKKHGVFEQEPNSHLCGIGCPSCGESKGEKEISKFLMENKIKFIPQHKFSDCKYKNLLPFDFYLPDLNLCVEYNGKQHYCPIKHFGGNEFLVIQQKRDKIKMEYCYYDNIPLIIIKYNEIIKDRLQESIHL